MSGGSHEGTVVGGCVSLVSKTKTNRFHLAATTTLVTVVNVASVSREVRAITMELFT